MGGWGLVISVAPQTGRRDHQGERWQRTMKSISILVAAVIVGCSPAPRQAQYGQIPGDCPRFVANLGCGMSAKDVDRVLSDNGLYVDRMGNAFQWWSQTPLGTNYSLQLGFDPRLNTIVLGDKRGIVLYSVTSVRRSGGGIWEPVRTMEGHAQDRQRGVEALLGATRTQMARVTALRAELATADHPKTKQSELLYQESLLAALTNELKAKGIANTASDAPSEPAPGVDTGAPGRCRRDGLPPPP